MNGQVVEQLEGRSQIASWRDEACEFEAILSFDEALAMAQRDEPGWIVYGTRASTGRCYLELGLGNLRSDGDMRTMATKMI